jgi:hypothetical protein
MTRRRLECGARLNQPLQQTAASSVAPRGQVPHGHHT